jgi:hypothetical protein
MLPLRDQVKDIVHQRNNDVQPREHFLATQWLPAQTLGWKPSRALASSTAHQLTSSVVATLETAGHGTEDTQGLSTPSTSSSEAAVGSLISGPTNVCQI